MNEKLRCHNDRPCCMYTHTLYVCMYVYVYDYTMQQIGFAELLANTLFWLFDWLPPRRAIRQVGRPVGCLVGWLVGGSVGCWVAGFMACSARCLLGWNGLMLTLSALKVARCCCWWWRLRPTWLTTLHIMHICHIHMCFCQMCFCINIYKLCLCVSDTFSASLIVYFRCIEIYIYIFFWYHIYYIIRCCVDTVMPVHMKL